jgi:hypothetical protein
MQTKSAAQAGSISIGYMIKDVQIIQGFMDVEMCMIMSRQQKTDQ